jgi:hypothetical protein
MSTFAVTRHLDRLALASRQQVVLRAVPLLATPLFVWLTVVLGSPFHPVLTTGLVLLALGTALLPDSSVPLFLVLTLATTWALQVPETLSWGTPVAALLLLAIHLACTLCGYGPPALALDRSTLAAWAGRALLMVSATAVVWLGTVLLAGLDLPAGTVPVVAGLGVALGWTAYLGRRLLTRPS